MTEQHRPKSGRNAHPTGKPAGEPPIRQARQKAESYREGRRIGSEQAGDNEPVRAMEEWSDIVSQRIEEAMRRGAFDRLPGRGRPLDLHNNPFAPEDQQMANKLLKNNDLTPAWIADRKQLLQDIETFRAKLQRASTEIQAQYAAAQIAAHDNELIQAWQVWMEEWTEEVARLNRRILDQNLRQPVDHLEILKIQLNEELERVGMNHTFASD